MSKFSRLLDELNNNPKKWVVTGAAGFIGSNLVEFLLKNNQHVTGLDNFSTGHPHNLVEIKKSIKRNQWKNFNFLEGEIQNYKLCLKAVENADYVLHQAALGSVPRSVKDPIASNSSNVNGFLNMLNASKEMNVKSFTYAASSSTYGDHPSLPKIEEKIGKPLSPYAATKYINEIYADVYSKVYDFRSIGLRYFNVFGKRQDPNGSYAAVIPKWISSLIKNEDIFINGDGLTSRDFCYIDNVIQMNILSALATNKNKNEVYNVAVGDRTSLISLFNKIKATLENHQIVYKKNPIYRDFRQGDVLHSQADISKAKNKLGYEPKYNFSDGIEETISWYIENDI